MIFPRFLLEILDEIGNFSLIITFKPKFKKKLLSVNEICCKRNGKLVFTPQFCCDMALQEYKFKEKSGNFAKVWLGKFDF